MEWINVKERLPEENTTVLVCKHNRLVCAMRYFNREPDLLMSKPHFYYNDIEQTSQITHWQNLPQPPQNKE